MPRTTAGRYWRHLSPGRFDAQALDGRVVHLTRLDTGDWSLAIPGETTVLIVTRYRDDAMLRAAREHLFPRGIRLVPSAER